jgi:hypothetical protein
MKPSFLVGGYAEYVIKHANSRTFSSQFLRQISGGLTSAEPSFTCFLCLIIFVVRLDIPDLVIAAIPCQVVVSM